MKKGLIGCCVLIGLLTLSSCQEKKADLLKTPLSREEFNIGTYISIKIYDKNKESTMDNAFNEIQNLEKKIEVNEEGSSELDDVNNAAGTGKPVKVSDEVFEIIQKSYDIAKETDNNFDPVIGALTGAWHIGFSDANKPSDDEIKSLLDKVDYKDIVLNEKDKTVYLKKKGMKFDLGGIGKGFIAEKVLELLKNEGVTTAILDFAGHVFVIGDNPSSDDGSWSVAVQDPGKAASTGQFASQNNIGTVSGIEHNYITSAMYDRYLLMGDTIYSQFIDPKTGYPYENDLLSVTIVGNDPIRDDGLSNAVYGMGLEKGLAYVNQTKGVEALLITTDNKIYLSDGLKDHFTLSEGEERYKLAE